MIKLDPPNLDAEDVFTTCIGRIRDPELRERMIAVTQEVVDASSRFEQLAAGTHLHQFIRQATVANLVNTAEMEAVYTQRMAKKKAPGRQAYEEIISLAPHGKCPLCGHRTVSTLDHHLPKAHYPVLAVVPLNLVPACSDCNKAKLASLPTRSREEAIHPYFDDIEQDRWLYAEVIEGAPAAVRFRVEAPVNWDDVLADRVNLHFRTLGLGPLYAAQAADELLNIRHQLRVIHEVGGMAEVRSEMEQRYASCRAARINSWRTAAFEAFLNSDWFCDGGFGQT